MKRLALKGLAPEMMSAAEVNYRKGTSLHEAGDFAGALAAFDISLQAAPRIAAVHYGCGNALVMLRRLEQAVEAYARCVEIEPGHVAALYNQATALAQLRRWQDAFVALDCWGVDLFAGGSTKSCCGALSVYERWHARFALTDMDAPGTVQRGSRIPRTP